MSDFTIELVRAFNISTYCSNLPDTNFKVENGSSMTMDFSPSLAKEQCTNYLVHLKKEIIGRFYNYADGAKRSFNFEAFPFNLAAVKILPNQESGGFRIKVDITSPVLFNLRCQLVHSMARPIKAEVEGNIVPKPFDRKKYLMRSQFEYKESADKFANEFIVRLSKLGYSKPGSVVVRGKEVYITADVFNDIDSVKGYVENHSWLIGRTLEDPIEKGSGVETLKGTLAQFIYNATNIKVGYYDRSSYEWSKQQTTFVPIVKNDSQQGLRYLKLNEVKAINCAFGFEVLNNVEECISDKLPVASPEKTKGIYGIDFYNKDISNCVINTLFENSVINKVGQDYGLEVQPNLKLLELYQKIKEMGLLQKPHHKSLSDREGGEPSHFAGMQPGASSQFVRLKLTRQQPSTSAGTSSWSATIEPVQGIFGAEQMTTQFRSFNMGGSDEPPLSLDFLHGLPNVPVIKGQSSPVRVILPKIPGEMTTTHVQPGVEALYASKISDKAQETGDQFRPKLKPIKRGGLLPSEDTSTDSNVSGTIYSCKEEDPLAQSRRSFDEDPGASSLGNQSSDTPRSQASDVKAEKSGGTSRTTQDQTKTSGNVKDKKTKQTKVSLAYYRDQVIGCVVYFLNKVVSPPSTPDPIEISTKGQRFFPNGDNGTSSTLSPKRSNTSCYENSCSDNQQFPKQNDTSDTQSSKRSKTSCHENPDSNLNNTFANQEFPKQMETMRFAIGD